MTVTIKNVQTFNQHMQVMSMSALGSIEKMPAYIPESRNLKRVYEKKRHDLLR